MLNSLKKFYKKEQFNPGIIGLFINPFYFARKGLHKNISTIIPNLHGKLLDIGCGSKPYKKLCEKVDEYIGIEIDDDGNRNHKYADVLYDGKTIPFKNNTFDSILCNQVFEHVFNPDDFLREINRVTKINGVFLLSVPFVWDEHEQPYDYARYSSFGLKYILNKNGFEISKHIKSSNGLEVIFQLINDYIYKKIDTENRYLNLIIITILTSPVNVVGLIISKIFPRNNDLYLDNIMLARKVKDV